MRRAVLLACALAGVVLAVLAYWRREPVPFGFAIFGTVICSLRAGYLFGEQDAATTAPDVDDYDPSTGAR